MMETSIEIDLATLGKQYGPIDLRAYDDLHYRFKRGSGTGSLTGVVTLRESVTLADSPPSGGTALTMDGTVGYLDISHISYGYPVVTTAQAGNDGVLHLFARARPAQTTSP
jgi:hypothetical protein